MEIRYATISKTGRRHNNEDAYKVIDMPQNNRFMGIVCDGMGGHSFGETASEMVCNTISDFWKKHISTPDCDSKVKLACKKASCAIDQKAFELHHAEMGTTLVMASIENKRIMRTCYTLFILGLTLLMFASCNREDISITYFKQLQSISDNTNKEDSLMMPCGFIEYDSVRFSDGSYAVHRLQYAPQNSLTEFFDNKGRTIATIARASECYAQTLVYDYDDEGRLSHLLQYKSEIFEGLDSDSTSYGRNKEGYLGFRQMIADMDYEHPDTAKYQQTNIEYDKDGDAVKAYIVYGSDSIVALSGYKLAIAVKPCLSFWQSDLHGGFYIFHVKMEPKRKYLPNYKVFRFADYLPSMESEYRNGRIVKTVWHHDPCIEPDDKDLVFIPIINDDLNVYSVTWEDGSKHQRVYKDGLLAYKQEISKYGTVLRKETYFFSSNSKVKVTYETIDYKTKALKTQSTSVMDVLDMEKFHEDMNVISGDYRWENYYNK